MRGNSGGEGMQNCNTLLALFPIQRSHTHGCHFTILAAFAFIDPSDGRGKKESLGILCRFYGQVLSDFGVQIRQLSKFIVQLSSVLFRYVFDLNKGGESW